MLFNNIKIHIISVFFVILFSMLYALFSIPPAYASTINTPPNFLKLSSGLVGWWTFDGKDMTNGRANDVSGNGNNGSLINIATSTFYAQGKIGQGLKFDGVNDAIKTTANFSGISGLSKITVTFWMKWNAYANDDDFAMEYTNNFNSKNGFVIDPNHSSGKFNVGLSMSGGSYNTSYLSSRPSAGIWHHYVIIFDRTIVGANIGQTAYVDGVLNTMTAGVQNYISATTFDAGVLYFMSRGSASLFGGGSLDDVRVYNRALSTSTITQLYNIGASTKLNVSPNTSLNNGLVGYWTFDGKDVVNGIALDKSGNGNNGNLINIATSTFYTQGKIGQGFKFDGVDDRIVYSTPFTWSTNTLGSISAWAKVNTVAASTFTTILSYGGSSNPTNGGLLSVRFEGNGTANLIKILHGVEGAGATILATTNKFAANTWYHVTVTSDGSTHRLYVNGVEETGLTGTNNGNWFGDAVPTGTVQTNIGAGYFRGSIIQFFPGTLDDVRVYNRVLSVGEVIELYNIGAAGKVNVSPVEPVKSGLVGYWTFDGKDVVNGVALDKSGNGNNGNLISIATSTFYAQGKIGQGFKFDGVNDAVNVGSGSSFTNLGQITLSVWINAKSFGQGSQSFIISKVGNCCSATNGWQLQVNPIVSSLRLSVDYDGANNLDTYSALNTFTSSDFNKWEHWVVTWDGTSSKTSVNFYKNGLNVGIYSAGSTDGVGNRVTDTTASLLLGGNMVSRTWDGLLDDVRIYNRALSTSTIQQLYNLGR